MIFSTRVTVTTEPQLVVPQSSNPQKVHLLNAGGEIVRIGGNAEVSATAAYGLPRLGDSQNAPRTEFVFELNPGEEIWAVVSQNTSALNVWYQRTD